MTDDFVKPLALWYNTRKRDLPWRRTREPYAIWVSEIMLQQTRVEAVIGYYERFLRELPTIRDLAAADEERLLKLWEGLGYYSRVRNMKRAAEVLTEQYGGVFPRDETAIRALPGIGSYTAGAVASIAFGLPAPAVDGNVLRVCARLTGLAENILKPSVKKRIEDELREILVSCPEVKSGSDDTDGMDDKDDKGDADGIRPGDFNQALIELGALVCQPNGAPKCGDCPLRPFCRACREGSWDRIPVREKNTKRRIEKLTVLIVRDGEKTAVRRRPDAGLLAGLYEFPTVPGHVTQSEAAACVEAAGCEALRVRPLGGAKHIFSHVEWQMIGYEVLTAMGSSGGADSWIFAGSEELRTEKAIASAYAAYAERIDLHLGKKRGKA